MIILGIDPGLGRMGYGVIEKAGSRLVALEYGLIETSPGPLPERLRHVHSSVCELVARHKPDAVASERQLFAANKTTAMDVAKALGVVLLATAELGVAWTEFSPPEVKLSVVGNGAAEKRQVQFMVQRLLGLEKAPKPDDVADALAVAITRALRG